jgi:hypothetical protein
MVIFQFQERCSKPFFSGLVLHPNPTGTTPLGRFWWTSLNICRGWRSNSALSIRHLGTFKGTLGDPWGIQKPLMGWSNTSYLYPCAGCQDDQCEPFGHGGVYSYRAEQAKGVNDWSMMINAVYCPKTKVSLKGVLKKLQIFKSCVSFLFEVAFGHWGSSSAPASPAARSKWKILVPWHDLAWKAVRMRNHWRSLKDTMDPRMAGFIL